MSMMEKQINEINQARAVISVVKGQYAEARDKMGFAETVLRHAAETIDELSAKVRANNIHGGWIPVEELLPPSEKEVFIKTEKGTVTTAMYEDGTVPDDESKWLWDIDMKLEMYDEGTDTYIVPKGWWEYRHFNPEEVYNNRIDEKVVSWMEIPN